MYNRHPSYINKKLLLTDFVGNKKSTNLPILNLKYNLSTTSFFHKYCTILTYNWMVYGTVLPITLKVWKIPYCRMCKK